MNSQQHIELSRIVGGLDALASADYDPARRRAPERGRARRASATLAPLLMIPPQPDHSDATVLADRLNALWLSLVDAHDMSSAHVVNRALADLTEVDS